MLKISGCNTTMEISPQHCKLREVSASTSGRKISFGQQCVQFPIRQFEEGLEMANLHFDIQVKRYQPTLRSAGNRIKGLSLHSTHQYLTNLFPHKLAQQQQ